MFGFTKKTVDAPQVNEIAPLTAVKLWYVRWQRRHGEFSHDVSQCVEAFPIESDAEQFADSLRAAFKLLRHTSGNRVDVSAKDHQVK